MQACRRHYPGGKAGGAELAPPDNLASSAFPIPLLGRLPHLPFRGLLGVHSRYGLSARGVAGRPFASEASVVSLPPLPLRLLPAGARSCRVGIAPTEGPRLSTAHKGAGSHFPFSGVKKAPDPMPLGNRNKGNRNKGHRTFAPLRREKATS